LKLLKNRMPKADLVETILDASKSPTEVAEELLSKKMMEKLSSREDYLVTRAMVVGSHDPQSAAEKVRDHLDKYDCITFTVKRLPNGKPVYIETHRKKGEQDGFK
jgi:hypothetical protein